MAVARSNRWRDVTVARPGILAIFNNVAPGREAEFEEWFQHEHLRERLGVPGFLLGRRYEAVRGEPRYFNFYLTRSAEVLNSADYRMRLNNPTPMTRMVMSEIFKDMIRTVCHQSLRIGKMRGTVAVVARFGERPDENELAAALEKLLQDKGVACGEVWSAASLGQLPVSEDRAFARRRPQDRSLSDGRDATGTGCRQDRRRALQPISACDNRRLSLTLRNQP